VRFLLKIPVLWLAVFTASHFAQHQDVIGLTDFPVPAWPSNGVVPETMKDKYVFLDLPKNEYVVAYPENLDEPNFAKDGPGKLRISRYELLRNVEPVVSVSVTPEDPSTFRYAYTVANASSAKQSIDQWIMALPERSAGDTVKTPQSWFGLLQKGRSFKLRNPEWIPQGTAAIWSFQKVDQVIPPGSSKTGFEITSQLRPGFTVAFVRKTESVDVKVTTHGNVPKEVREQMDQILMLEYNSRTILTIGPKFDKAADARAIADDFIQGIVTLSRAGDLDLSSDFCRGLLSQLTASDIKLDVTPKTALETELFNALKISLVR